jgi:acetylornithine aminotransferase
MFVCLTDSRRYVMNTYSRAPLLLSHGKECIIYDKDGKKYLDMAAGIATWYVLYTIIQCLLDSHCNSVLGHAHPKLIDAITKQIGKVHHVSNLYYIPEQVPLHKRGAGIRCDCDMRSLIVCV